MENQKYFKKVLKDFDKELKALQTAKSTEMVSVHERAIRPIFIELQLAVPRLGEDIFKASRERRRELSEGKK